MSFNSETPEYRQKLVEPVNWRAPCRPLHITLTFELDGLVGRETIALHPHMLEPTLMVFFRAGMFLGKHVPIKLHPTFRILECRAEQP